MIIDKLKKQIPDGASCRKFFEKLIALHRKWAVRLGL